MIEEMPQQMMCMSIWYQKGCCGVRDQIYNFWPSAYGFEIVWFHAIFYLCLLKDEIASHIFILVLYIISNHMELRKVID